MAVKTKIQWCDSTVNPTMGCDGCEIWGSLRRSCYAGTLHTRFGGVTQGYAPTFEEVTMVPGRMAQAASYSDLTDKSRPDKPWLLFQPSIPTKFILRTYMFGPANRVSHRKASPMEPDNACPSRSSASARGSAAHSVHIRLSTRSARLRSCGSGSAAF